MSESAISLKRISVDTRGIVCGAAYAVKELDTTGCENDTFYDWACQDG